MEDLVLKNSYSSIDLDYATPYGPCYALLGAKGNKDTFIIQSCDLHFRNPRLLSNIFNFFFLNVERFAIFEVVVITPYSGVRKY